ncbi:ferredoxin [Saccharothrix deserti]|uniref:ferredoxin n=1 Tax=Saccharothrix deserti TaxID=2593674 RepID=UPI00308428B8
MTATRVVVDRETCVGSGNCVFAEPRVFDQDEVDGRVVLRADTPSALTAKAVAGCPVRAITLVDAAQALGHA